MLIREPDEHPVFRVLHTNEDRVLSRVPGIDSLDDQTTAPLRLAGQACWMAMTVSKSGDSDKPSSSCSLAKGHLECFMAIDVSCWDVSSSALTVAFFQIVEVEFARQHRYQRPQDTRRLGQCFLVRSKTSKANLCEASV